jgi:hypothetical protein
MPNIIKLRAKIDVIKLNYRTYESFEPFASLAPLAVCIHVALHDMHSWMPRHAYHDMNVSRYRDHPSNRPPPSPT